MKSVLIALRDLRIGGIEKSAITLIKFLKENGYDITLVLEEKEGELLEKVDKSVKIILYRPSNFKLKIIRKIINLLKQINFKVKYKNRFDVSISYATYSKPDSFVARVASKNSILWCHADYLALFDNKKFEVKKFFEEIAFDEFSKIVFVAKSAMNSFKEVFPNKTNLYYCNNLIDVNEIYEKAKEKILIHYNREITTFLNVGRHDEKQKKLTRIIKAASLLKRENYKFRIIFVGSGQDSTQYKKMVKKYKLQKNIFFEGSKTNPYPYYQISDCVILSSDYEGYPVVFLESFLFNIPIITTDVSDYGDILQGRGIVTSKNTKSIYKAMKKYMENGYIINKEFDAKKYNKQIKNKLKEILKSS